MSKRYFPIQTDTSCRLKWSWSSIFLNSGLTKSCHRSAASTIPENFNDFHNTDIKIKHREIMLKGEWPGQGCQYCRDIETSGGVSDRQFQNQIPNVYPDELDNDATLTTVTPSIVEVFFSNTCNLSCVYCTAKFSSSIQAENKKFGGSILPNANFLYEDNQYNQLVSKFWTWMQEHGTNLQRLQILGGEPFLQKDFYKLLEFIKATPCPNLELNFVTNLSVPEKTITPIIEKLDVLKQNKLIKRVDIQTSIDCWSPAQEYIRHGINLNLFENNIVNLIEKSNFRIGLLSTITSLSIPSLVELAVKRNQWSNQQEIFWYMHLVLPNSGSVFDPVVFEYDVYRPYIDQMYNLLPNNTWDDKTTLETFDGIVSKLKNNCENNIARQKELLNYLTQNDQRRHTNWKISFPWLEQEFQKNNVV